MEQDEIKEQPMWENGPIKSVLDVIKAELAAKGYPSDLYVLSAGATKVVSRIIPRVEYNEIGKKQFAEAVAKKLSPTAADELFNNTLVGAAVVWAPEDFSFTDDKMTACGIVPTLIDKIMELNGFDSTPPIRI
jgi:hypothetical protein